MKDQFVLFIEQVNKCIWTKYVFDFQMYFSWPKFNETKTCPQLGIRTMRHCMWCHRYLAVVYFCVHLESSVPYHPLCTVILFNGWVGYCMHKVGNWGRLSPRRHFHLISIWLQLKERNIIEACLLTYRLMSTYCRLRCSPIESDQLRRAALARHRG